MLASISLVLVGFTAALVVSTGAEGHAAAGSAPGEGAAATADSNGGAAVAASDSIVFTGGAQRAGPWSAPDMGNGDESSAFFETVGDGAVAALSPCLCFPFLFKNCGMYHHCCGHRNASGRRGDGW